MVSIKDWKKRIGDSLKNANPLTLMKMGISLLVLGAFAVVWVALALPYWNNGGDSGGVAAPTEFQLVIAGLLAASVSTGTAAVLGVKVSGSRTAKQVRENSTILSALGTAKVEWDTKYKLVAIGVATYAGVGVVVGATAWKTRIPPDYLSTFTLTFAGWIAGVFGTVFSADVGLRSSGEEEPTDPPANNGTKGSAGSVSS